MRDHFAGAILLGMPRSRRRTLRMLRAAAAVIDLALHVFNASNR
jgi:hypothetical protein